MAAHAAILADPLLFGERWSGWIPNTTSSQGASVLSLCPVHLVVPLPLSFSLCQYRSGGVVAVFASPLIPLVALLIPSAPQQPGTATRASPDTRGP